MTEEQARDLSEQILGEFGISYDPARLIDPDFCFKEIGRFGYSLSVVLVTLEEYVVMRARNGLLPDPEFASTITESGGVYSYQLKGRQYESRGSHSSPLLRDLGSACGTALYNVIRLRPEEDS